MIDQPLPMFAPGSDPGPSFFELLRRRAPDALPGANFPAAGLSAGGVTASGLQVPHGTTIVCLKFAGGVVMAGDRRATEGYTIASRRIDKVSQCDHWSAMAIAGAAGPGLEMVRFVSSGTEALMSAVRLARAATRRRLILKFDGCYHGHADALLAAAGSGVATLGLPDSPGVTPGTVAETLVVAYNDLAAVENLFSVRGSEIAAVLVEPVAGNMGLVPPVPGFLEGLRTVTRHHGALLVFDEVMTGWRVHPQGAQVLYGVRPDITCLGKVVGGGLPAAVYGGSRELMELIAPAGPVYQAGTLSGNPLAMAAGLATLDVLSRPGVWQTAADWAEEAATMIAAAAGKAGVAIQVQRAGTMFTPFFGETPVRTLAEAKQTDGEAYRQFFHAMLDAGIYLPASPYEAAFTSVVHGEHELELLESALDTAWHQ